MRILALSPNISHTQLVVGVVLTALLAVSVSYAAQNTYEDLLDYLEDGEQDGYDDGYDDDHITMLKRYYRGWGHRSRFPWKRLRHWVCFREPCKSNKDCCYLWNICDKSAKVCSDCWYGSNCKTESECCAKYPYCSRTWKKSKDGMRYIAGGKCVKKL